MYIFYFRNNFDGEIIALFGKDYMAALADYEQDPDAIPIEAYTLIDVLVEDLEPWQEDCDFGDPMAEDC